MPPKPWETRKRPTLDNISEIIQSNPTPKEEIPKISTDPLLNSAIEPPGVAPANLAATAPSIGNTYGTGYGGGYGSYGGYGGYGGYGSSYGGYGMGMGMGMYGMGRYGMMGQNQQQGVLFNTMMALESFTYLINCLCEIARSMDQNYEGLSLFYKSFQNLMKRMESSVVESCKWVVTKIKNFFLAILNFFVQNIFFMGTSSLKSKYRSVKFILWLSIVVLCACMFPQLRSVITARSVIKAQP